MGVIYSYVFCHITSTSANYLDTSLFSLFLDFDNNFIKQIAVSYTVSRIYMTLILSPFPLATHVMAHPAVLPQLRNEEAENSKHTRVSLVARTYVIIHTSARTLDKWISVVKLNFCWRYHSIRLTLLMPFRRFCRLVSIYRYQFFLSYLFQPFSLFCQAHQDCVLFLLLLLSLFFLHIER